MVSESKGDTMSKRLAIVLGVIAVMVFGGAVAFAQTGPDGEESVISGTGYLKASGSGTVSVDMAGARRMAVDGDATIVDLAGDARVHIGAQGDRAAEAEALAAQSTYELTGFQGLIAVTGSDFTVEVDGFTAFRAKGTGTAELTGEGVWETRHDWGFWSPDGAVLDFEQ